LINTETSALKDEISHLFETQKGHIESEMESVKKNDPYKEKLQQMKAEWNRTASVVERLSKFTQNELLNTNMQLGEMNENFAELKNASPTSNKLNLSVEAEFDRLSDVVENASSDIQMKLGTKVDRLESLLVLMGVKIGVKLPDRWDGDGEKLASSQLHQQQILLEQKQKQLQKIKKEMEEEAKKLREIRKQNEQQKGELKNKEKELANEKNKNGSRAKKFKYGKAE